MPKPSDMALYETVKARVYAANSKHSAYRSASLVKAYKAAYAKKHGDKKAYSGPRNDSKGLTRWMAEEWRNQRGGVGYKYKSDIYRPTKRVTFDTPTTLGELSDKRIAAARRKKSRDGRVDAF